MDAPLLRQEASNGERYVVVSDEGKSAITHFAILERFIDATLIEARPSTGRTHQIRVHTQLSGCPIIGDEKYSRDASRKQFADRGIKRLCLHAVQLSLTHPESGQQFTVSAPWDAQFSAAASLLRRAGD